MQSLIGTATAAFWRKMRAEEGDAISQYHGSLGKWEVSYVKFPGYSWKSNHTESGERELKTEWPHSIPTLERLLDLKPANQASKHQKLIVQANSHLRCLLGLQQLTGALKFPWKSQVILQAKKRSLRWTLYVTTAHLEVWKQCSTKGETKRGPLLHLLRDTGGLASPAELWFSVVRSLPPGYQSWADGTEAPHPLALKAWWPLHFLDS